MIFILPCPHLLTKLKPNLQFCFQEQHRSHLTQPLLISGEGFQKYCVCHSYPFCFFQRYGHNAGEATHNAVDSAINVGLTAYNIDNIGIKAMVKRTAKQTGHRLLEDYQIIHSSQKESQEASADVGGNTEKQAEEEEKGAKNKDK